VIRFFNSPRISSPITYFLKAGGTAGAIPSLTDTESVVVPNNCQCTNNSVLSRAGCRKKSEARVLWNRKRVHFRMFHAPAVAFPPLAPTPREGIAAPAHESRPPRKHVTRIYVLNARLLYNSAIYALRKLTGQQLVSTSRVTALPQRTVIRLSSISFASRTSSRCGHDDHGPVRLGLRRQPP
jgi:hypothetical protein